MIDNANFLQSIDGMIGGIVSYIVINGIILFLDLISFGRLRPDYSLREDWWTAAFSRSFVPHWIRYLHGRFTGNPIPWHEDDLDFGSDDEKDHPDDIIVNNSGSIADATTDIASLNQSHYREKTAMY